MALLKVFIAAHPSVGHVTGLLTIGRHLRASGADVRFGLPFKKLPRVPLPSMITTAFSLPPLIEAAGLRFVPLPADPLMLLYGALMPWTSGARELRLAARMMTTGIAATVRQLEEEFDREPVDIIVGDFGFLAAALVAERRKVPFIAFFHAGLPFPHEGVYPFTGGADFSRAVDARVASIRAELQMAPVAAGLLDVPFPNALNLLATTPALEGRAADFGAHTRWVGPCVDGRVEEGVSAFPFARLRTDAVKVYLSLGTVFNRHPARFRTLIDGMRGPGVQIVVSAGPSFRALESLASEDLLIFPSVPQLAVLKAVDFVASHGGNNTVNETLLAGRPLLVLPIGGEQEANAQRVVRLGAGLPLDRDRLTVANVREAFVRLRGDPSYRLKAESIARESSGSRGAAEAARLIIERGS